MRLVTIHFLMTCILFFLPGFVFAQSYPSPTFQVLTLQTPLSVANGGTGTTSSIGTGALLLANAPTITTPTLIGVSNGSNAMAGAVGEYLSASASSVSLTTNTFTNLASLTLSAGDWNVSGGFYISDSGGTLNNIAAGISMTSASLTQPGTYAQLSMSGVGGFGSAVPTIRVSVSASTTVYLVGFAGIVSGSAYANGLIQARRVR